MRGRQTAKAFKELVAGKLFRIFKKPLAAHCIKSFWRLRICGLGPWAQTHGPQGLPARGRRAGGRRRGSPWGPWARAHGPMISAYFGLFGLISAHLEIDSCLFQIIWTLIPAYLSLFEIISA